MLQRGLEGETLRIKSLPYLVNLMKPDWYKFRPQTGRRKVYEPMTTREKRNVTFENQAEGLRVSDQSATIGGMLTT